MKIAYTRWDPTWSLQTEGVEVEPEKSLVAWPSAWSGERAVWLTGAELGHKSKDEIQGVQPPFLLGLGAFGCGAQLLNTLAQVLDDKVKKWKITEDMGC